MAVTQTALERVRSFRAQLPQPEGQGLWVGVSGSADGEYTCALTLNPLSGARAEPRHPRALPTLPMSGSPGSGAGLPSPPPVTPRTPAQGDLVSELARRVMAVLDRDVNPIIADHGGHAELAGIEGRTAYLRLGGGCQGCGMASVTLNQGIEVAITEAVPEIDDVVDVTDHASGSNPYFEPAKK